MTTRRSKMSYPPSERRAYGVIATIANTETGETRVEVRRGDLTTLEAVRQIADLCDHLGPEWKIRTLSHPLSILADLWNENAERPQLTEATLLGQIGRADLIEHRSKWLGLRVNANRHRRDAA